MNRRLFLQLGAVAGLGIFAAPPMLWAAKKRKKDLITTQYILNQIFKEAKAGKWEKLPIGERIGKIAQLLIGTRYEGGTLESADFIEVCKLELMALDCVTFFENSLAIARCLGKGKTSYDDVIAELTFTRYRDGKLNDYTSRLHYTTEWIANNAQKGVIRDISAQLGGVETHFTLNFMSKHPKLYKPLQNTPAMIETIAGIEEKVSALPFYVIPTNRIADIESQLQTGDIVAVATDKKGLDYSHTGLIYRDEQGVAHFFHASSKKKQVIIGEALHEYALSSKGTTGVSILRPLEVA